MIKIYFLLFFLTPSTWASFPELFGASTSTSMISNQASNNFDDPALNYYCPALLAYAKRPLFSVSQYLVNYDFKKINGIQVRNTLTTEENLVADADVKYETHLQNAYHLSLPILKEDGVKFSLSAFVPTNHFQESNSGDPYGPDYIMFHSRPKRTVAHMNIVNKFNESFSYSFGFYSGMQVNAETDLIARYNGTGKPSSAKMKAKASPTISPIISFTYRHENKNLSYFTYQHRMKSKLLMRATGATRDSTLNFPYDITMNSMMYYDPSILRFGHLINLNNLKIATSLEYQMWEGYKSPIITIEQNGGFIVSSSNYENLRIRNTISPHFGLTYDFEYMTLASGYAYRQTPLKGSFSGNGNSLDANTHVFSMGASKPIAILGFKTNLESSLQVHHLQDKKVEKTPGKEDGTAGNKIGYPGYTVGGNIYTVGLGAKIEF